MEQQKNKKQDLSGVGTNERARIELMKMTIFTASRYERLDMTYERYKRSSATAGASVECQSADEPEQNQGVVSTF